MLLLAFVLVGACGPKEDYTPQIPIQPNAAARVCFFCIGQRRSANDACPPEVEASCHRLLSDVVGPDVRVVDDAD